MSDQLPPYSERICPFMSRPLSATELGNNLLPPEMFWANCQGPSCMCFRWGPATAYLDGETVDLPHGGPDRGWCSLSYPNRSE